MSPLIVIEKFSSRKHLSIQAAGRMGKRSSRFLRLAVFIDLCRIIAFAYFKFAPKTF